METSFFSISTSAHVNPISAAPGFHVGVSASGDFLLGGAAGGQLVFSFESSGQGGPKIRCLSEHYN